MAAGDASSAQDKSVSGAQRANRGQRKSIGDPATPFVFDGTKSNTRGYSEESVTIESVQPQSRASRPGLMQTMIERRQNQTAALSLRQIHQAQLKKKMEPKVERNDKGILVIRA